MLVLTIVFCGIGSDNCNKEKNYNPHFQCVIYKGNGLEHFCSRRQAKLAVKQ